MAIDRNFLGFESGHTSVDAVNSATAVTPVADGTARTGEWYAAARQRTASTNSGFFTFTAPTAGQSIADNHFARGRHRFWFRLIAYPSASNVKLGGFGSAAGQNTGSILLDSTGHWAPAASNTSGSFSAAALSLNVWYMAELELVLTNPPAGGSTADATATIYDATGALVGTATVLGGVASATPSIQGASCGHGDAVSSTFLCDFDDCVWVVEDDGLATLPTATRVSRVDASAQGASAAWTGDYRLINETPRETATTNEQTTSGSGNTTTFTHRTAAALGLTGIEAVKVYGFLKASGGAGADALMLNGTEYATATQVAYPTRPYQGIDWSSYSSVQFDAMEFGARNKRGVATELAQVFLEVLHAGTDYQAAAMVGVESWKHKVVVYTGNGTFQTIAGIGFRPQFVLVKKTAGGSSLSGQVKVAQMGGTQSKTVGSGYSSIAITRFTDDGFDLGPSLEVNQSGVEFQAICIQDGGGHTSGYFMHAGAYLGDGTDNRDIVVEAGWQPDFVIVFGAGGEVSTRDSGNVGDQANRMGLVAAQADEIQAFNANGFQVGTVQNDVGLAEAYLAIRTSADLPGFAFGSFLGVGATQAISGLTFQPETVVAKRNAIGNDAFWRGRSIANHTAAASCQWNGNTITNNGVSALATDGFTLGSTCAGAGDTSHWFAFSLAEDVAVATPEIEFGDEDQSGQTIGLHWIHFFDKAGTEHVWSKLFLADPASYYGGPKEDRVIRFGLVKRALSDPRGEYEGTTFSWVLSDTDHALRGLLANLATKWIKGRNVIMRTVSDVARRAFQTPRTVVRGIAMSAKPVSPLHFEMTAQDWFAAKFTVGKSEQQIPRRTITAADFPNCPAGTLARTVPIVYGNLSDQNDQSYTVPGTPGTAPTVGLSKPQVTATVVGGAGTATRRYAVTALDNRANQHNDFALNANHEGETDADIITVTNAPDDGQLSSTRYIALDWPEVPGAFYYRIYGRYPDFDLCMLDSADVGERYHDGERNGNTEVDSLKTDSHPPSTNGTVVGGNPATPESTITTDTGAGAVPVIYVGLREVSGANWHEFLVCGHAVKAITGWYGGGVRFPNTTEGVDFLIPGFGGYTAAVGAATYREFNGHRYTVIYARGPNGDRGADGSNPITINVQGIEETGDGTGTLITDVIQQYKHALKNWLVGDYQAGAWLDSPTFDDDATLTKIDEASFDTASTAAAARLAGGYPGAMLIGAGGEQASLREMIARFNLNCDVDSGFNRKTQFAVFMESDQIDLLANAITLTQTREIFAESFEIEDLDDRHENVVPYSFAYDYRNGKWGTETEVRDQESIDNYEVELLAERVLLHFIRVADVATDISRRRLARSADPPRLARFTVGLIGLSIELGQIVLITHTDGVGSSGWNITPVRIVRHEFDPDGYSVRLEAFDATRVFSGAFILGDETALPNLWTAATATQKRYGYLGDETTEQFSDGTAIKRLR